MTTYVRSGEAARLLGVTPATLYAYVSRGRIGRVTGPDGRTSLFDLGEIERLSARGRARESGPRPTIDVQITSAVTVLGDEGVHHRGIPIDQLVDHRFEDVAELLWSGHLGSGRSWDAPEAGDSGLVDPIRAIPARPISRLSMAAHALGDAHSDDDCPTAARRLLTLAPPLLGGSRRNGSFAVRLTSVWTRRPPADLVGAVDRALVLLADHGLATSTLAVRVAASARCSPGAALAAGLAAVDGELHGSASALVHEFLVRCAAGGVEATVDRARVQGEHIPGFGHKIYRRSDPRFALLMEAVRPLAPVERLAVLDELVAVVGRRLPHQPNVDLALGALTFAADLDPQMPLFAVARIAGWAAHCAEEFDAPPLRFRGQARATV